MNTIFPDLLRGAISTVANVLLMMTLLQPKYSKRITGIAMFGIFLANFGTAVYCYISGNLTLLSKIDIILFAVLCFVARPLFKDSFMQWLFSYLTVLNISYAVIIFSFIASRKLPYPPYSNSALRLILFGTFILLLSHYGKPLYRQVVERWTIYFAVALSFHVTIAYYVMSSENIVATFTEQAIPLLLIIFIGLAAYCSIFLSMKNLQREYHVKEENQKMQTEREYLQLAAGSMSRRLELMEDVSAMNSRMAHDQRHFNNVVLELIEQGKTPEAVGLLQKQIERTPSISKVYCDNPAVNAAVCHYVKLAEQYGMAVEVTLDIPRKTAVDSLELSMVVSNLMENGIQACKRIPNNRMAYMRFTCRNVGRLLMEIENPCEENTELGKDGYPVAFGEGHGVGTKSVVAFVKKYDGELLYKVENDTFRVRLLV